MSGGTDDADGGDGAERDALGSWPPMPDRPPEADDPTPASGGPGPIEHSGYQPSVPPVGHGNSNGDGDGDGAPTERSPGFGPPPGYGSPTDHGSATGHSPSAGYGPAGYPAANPPPPSGYGYGTPGYGYGTPGYGYGASGYGAPGYGYPYGYQYPVQPRTDGLAAGALVASIAGILLTCFCVGIAGGIAGIIMGNVARRRIRASNGMLLGDGLAVAAIIVGAINVLLTVIWFIYIAAQ
jgi:hypothetical protein